MSGFKKAFSLKQSVRNLNSQLAQTKRFARQFTKNIGANLPADGDDEELQQKDPDSVYYEFYQETFRYSTSMEIKEFLMAICDHWDLQDVSDEY